MADTASQTTRIAAPPDRVWAIAADVEHYPEWAKDVKDVVVRARDGEGRPTEVEFRASALGRSTHYTLAYDYSQAPAVLSWSLLRGDIMRTIDGAYHFAAASSVRSSPVPTTPSAATPGKSQAARMAKSQLCRRKASSLARIPKPANR